MDLIILPFVPLQVKTTKKRCEETNDVFVNIFVLLLLDSAMLETCHERVTGRRMRRCADGVTILVKRKEKKVFLNVYTHKKCETIIL